MRADNARRQRTTASGAVFSTELRLGAIDMINGGERRQAVADRCGVTPTTISSWVKAYRQGNLASLRTQRTGPRSRQRLTAAQEEEVIRRILAGPPSEDGLPFKLWTMKALLQLLRAGHGVRLSSWTMRQYLRKWGFSSQKEVRRAFRTQPSRAAGRLQEHQAQEGSPASRGTASRDTDRTEWRLEWLDTSPS
jgi:transposase